MKKNQVNIYLDDKLYEQLVLISKKYKWSLSKTIVKIIEKVVATR